MSILHESIDGIPYTFNKFLRQGFGQLKSTKFLKLLASTNNINIAYEPEMPYQRTERDNYEVWPFSICCVKFAVKSDKLIPSV